MAINYFDSKTVKDIRTSCGLSQEEFWGQYGVTQSAGSRYEKTRVPEEFAILNYLVYAKGLDIKALREEMLSAPELKLKRTVKKTTRTDVLILERIMPLDRETQTATCIGCGCDDLHACVDIFHGSCHWLAVDYKKGIGVCSSCSERMYDWDEVRLKTKDIK